jgi:hypothetical protein
VPPIVATSKPQLAVATSRVVGAVLLGLNCYCHETMVLLGVSPDISFARRRRVMSPATVIVDGERRRPVP